MELDFSLFAEAAEVKENGMINLLGGRLDFVSAPAFPATFHSLFVVVSVLASPAEFEKDHEFLCEVVGPNGKKVTEDVHLVFNPRKHPRKEGVKNWQMLLIRYVNLVLPAPGDCVFKFSVDGKWIGERVLELVKE